MHSYAERSVKLPGPHLLFGPDFSVSDRRSGDVSGDVSILDVTGPLRGERAAQAFRRHVWDLLNEGVKKLAVNLTEAGDIDSGGLGALAAAYNQVKQENRVLRCAASSKPDSHQVASRYGLRDFQKRGRCGSGVRPAGSRRTEIAGTGSGLAGVDASGEMMLGQNRFSQNRLSYLRR
jgi:anti-anti-sigma regulatory factor